MNSSQDSIEIFTEPPLEVTMEMMSQTTTSLLANMAMNVSISGVSGIRTSAISLPFDANAYGVDSHSSNATTNCTLHYLRNESKSSTKSHPLESNHRIIGPNETLYLQKYDSVVRKIMCNYDAHARGKKLPKYRDMSDEARATALSEVDQLLNRMNFNSYTSCQLDTGKVQVFNKQTSHCSNIDGQDYSNEKSDKSIQSEQSLSLPSDDWPQQSGPSTTTMREESNMDYSGASATTMEYDHSVSVLEESMILLSEDESQRCKGAADVDEELSRFSAGDDCERNRDYPSVSPIERTRHCHKPSLRYAVTLRDMDEASSPLVPTHKQSSKRCASNSGKRGLRSRYRSNVDDFGGEDAENSLLRHFDQGGKGIYCDDGDSFSCGSPIQRKSCDGEFDIDCEEEGIVTLPELATQKNLGVSTAGYRGRKLPDDETLEQSCFSPQEDDAEFDGDGYENEEFNGTDVPEKDHRRQTNHLISQWNTFQNADPKLTSTQDEDENESPVRRRAIRFDGHSQQTMTSSLHQVQAAQGDQLAIESQRDDELYDGSVVDMGVDSRAITDHDTIQTVRNLSRRAKVLESRGINSSLLDEVAPTDIRLKHGVNFRVDPLCCRQPKGKVASHHTSKYSDEQHSRHASAVKPKRSDTSIAAGMNSSCSNNSLSDPEECFIDPIARFPTRVAARLNTAFNFVLKKEREGSDSHEACGVLLSMPIQQILSVTIKVLIQTIESSRKHQRSMNDLPVRSKRYTPMNIISRERDVLAGGTLIVLRGKEEVANWEVALREYTSLSVINHAELLSNIRKLSNTAAKCAGFDVVLSTYDALKSKEVTIPVDEKGRAILDRHFLTTNSFDDGERWLISRAARTQSGTDASQKCHQLSVLHRMLWYRLIMLDVLGRRGFLVKNGTARAQAAIAINSASRFILFEEVNSSEKKDKNDSSVIKLKDDRRSLRSVASVVQLPATLKLDRFISKFVLDVSKVCANDDQKAQHNRSTSISMSEEGKSSSDDDLTDPY